MTVSSTAPTESAVQVNKALVNMKEHIVMHALIVLSDLVVTYSSPNMISLFYHSLHAILVVIPDEVCWLNKDYYDQSLLYSSLLG